MSAEQHALADLVRNARGNWVATCSCGERFTAAVIGTSTALLVRHRHADPDAARIAHRHVTTLHLKGAFSAYCACSTRASSTRTDEDAEYLLLEHLEHAPTAPAVPPVPEPAPGPTEVEWNTARRILAMRAGSDQNRVALDHLTRLINLYAPKPPAPRTFTVTITGDHTLTADEIASTLTFAHDTVDLTVTENPEA